MKDFFVWLEAISIDQVKNIKKNVKDYKPGTFGVELEFRVESDENEDLEIDYDELVNVAFRNKKVMELFYENNPEPLSPEDWEENNPEPRDLYAGYEPNQNFSNYIELDLFKRNAKIDTDKLFEKMDKSRDSLLLKYANKLLYSYINTGIKEVRYEQDWEEFKNKINEIQKIQTNEYDFKDLIIQKYKELINWHQKRIDQIDEEVYEDELDKLTEIWEEKRQEAQEEHDNYETDFDDNFREFVINNVDKIGRIIGGERIPYIEQDPNPDSLSSKIEQYINFIGQYDRVRQNNSSEKYWGVGEDGDEMLEIRSKIMTTKDIPTLIALLKEIDDNGERVDGGTSAHVHIGMPKNSDAFDLLAMVASTNESDILPHVGANRELGRWAATKSDFLNKELSSRFDVGIYNNDEAMNTLDILPRYTGVNLSAFFKLGTVEFRYLSSQVVENPKKFIELIQYFLLLPRIAQSRKQIKIDNKLFTRLPNGKIQVSINSVSIPSESPNELRKDKSGAYFGGINKLKLKLMLQKNKDLLLKNLYDSLNEDDKLGWTNRFLITSSIGEIMKKSPNIKLVDAWGSIKPKVQKIIFDFLTS